MEELFELRKHIEQGNYTAAIALLGEMEEMSRDDKINKIGSLIEILLLHIIKQHAEQRSARSWDVSIQNALDNIEDINKRRKSGGYYLGRGELEQIIAERFPRALRRASLEAFEGSFDASELAEKIDAGKIRLESLKLIFDSRK
ncbi:MAG: hypothetical protein BWK80_59440 [Desulfobacteraceae bacterium IS3]|nr:MAG: hypothetical protein BWK80_59440 [Desulfobacteraceae bacterium IS3]